MTTKRPVVVFETNKGNFEVTLFTDIAPKTCENFLGLAKKDYYKDVIFHRVIKNFMIQGGDPTGTGRGGESLWGGKFNDEFSKAARFDRPGLLAMANAGLNTNGSQFFITTAPTNWLNDKHTIFGEVTQGYEVVKAIESTKTGLQDRPVDPIKILKIYPKSE
ncbi:MAG: peptidylprolyl isomerase [Verrucomicrobia bacterium]|nr:peptidylprolyl isomerase [Verrucomicrobiota bacterium]